MIKLLGCYGITIHTEDKVIQPMVNEYNWKHPRKKIAKWKVRKWHRFAVEKQMRLLKVIMDKGRMKK